MSPQPILQKYLESKGAFTTNINPMINRAMQCISGEVPDRLKLSITLSELITFTSHLRKNIVLHDGTFVPCNAIVFALSGSGTAKDSSMNMVRKALKPGYEFIDKIRKEEAKTKAEKMALLDGKSKEEWLSYYEKPKDLAAGLGSVEGLTKHFKDLEAGSIGAGSINASEIGSELVNNGSMGDIIKTISISYDLGKIPAKIIKSSENQTESIDCLPISALFFGSQDAILYDTKIKNMFKTVFTTQLGRRTIFSFTPEDILPPDFKSDTEVFEYRQEERDRTVYAQKLINNSILDIATNTDQDPLPLSEEAQKAFDIYKEYNQSKALHMSAHYPINKLARKHKQWAALKLSGNYAILDGNEYITEENYIQALNTIEIFSEDLMNFEKELVKEPYEIFCEFCKHNAEDGKYTISLHTLRKLGYIATTGVAKTKVEELVHLASSYDQDAIYTACAEGVCYEEQVKTSVAGVSYLPVSGDKEERGWQCHEGFEFFETTFEDLSNLLQEDFAYGPFQFKNGKRDRDSIIGGTKFIVLDIDKSLITDEECHLMLEGINHHIARTSDPDNNMKFRVLIELDAMVDIGDQQWSYFIKEVSKDLGLVIDPVPKSQIFFSYEGRNVLSEINGEPLQTKHYITKSSTIMANKPKPTKISTTQQKTLLDDKLETFSFAFNAAQGEGGRSLMRAAYYARDLQASHEYIVALMHEINKYWTYSMPEKRLQSTVLNQIDRWF